MMKKLLPILCVIVWISIGCKKDELPNDILSPIPQISLESISPTTAQARVDEIIFDVFYDFLVSRSMR